MATLEIVDGDWIDGFENINDSVSRPCELLKLVYAIVILVLFAFLGSGNEAGVFLIEFLLS